MFVDSISENLERLEQLIQGIPLEGRRKALKAAHMIEKAVSDLAKAYPKDMDVGIGSAWAIFKLADRIASAEQQGDKDKGVIELLR